MRKISLLTLSLMASFGAFADGKIVGKVTDGKNNETLIGVYVTVYKTGDSTEIMGTSSDIDGRFEFTLPAGSYEVKSDYIGFQPKMITDILVEDDKANNISVVFSEKAEAQDLGTVIVRGTAKKETINAIYIQQKNAATVSDGISADVIAKSPDKNTGEALKRVSGTTIQNGKYVIVRGMNDRYNVAMVDNAILPSTEPNRKAFSFDIIPSAMIDNIVITKSGSPDLPGDFSGGAINIVSKEIPAYKYTNVSIGTGFNTASTGKEFLGGYRSSTDILGFDDGSRSLPKGLLSWTQMQNPNNFNPNSNEQNKKYISMFNNDFKVRSKTAMPSLSFQLAHGRVFDFENGGRLGFNSGVTFGHSENIKRNISRQYDNYDYLDNVYNYKSNLGLILNFGYYKGGSKILFKNIYNRIFDDNYLSREGINTSTGYDVKYSAYDLVQKSLLKSTLIGEHKVGSGQQKLNWLLSYNLVTNSQPDQRKITYNRTTGTNDPFFINMATVGKANNRLFSNMNEHIVNANVNYSIPLDLFTSSTLKFGIAEQLRMRDFSNRYLGFKFNPSNPASNDLRFKSVEDLFTAESVSNDVFRLEEITNNGDIYKAQTLTSAAYLMMDNLVQDKFRFVYGVRFEHQDVNLDSYNKNEVSRSSFDFLPSLNFTYLVNDKTNIRASYFRSLVRPELREMANLGYFDYELNATMLGNPALKRGSVQNVDLKYEYFPRPSEILAASIFYKKFTNTIENEVYISSSYEIQPKNYKNGYNAGVELELRKRLDFINDGKLLRNTTFYTNVALVKSSISLPESFVIRNKKVTSRPLTGQSPIVVNSSLGYASEDGKFSANLLYNYIGQRIHFTGSDQIGNVYEIGRSILDLSASYNITEKAALRITFKDLLNSPIGYYIDQNVDGKRTKVVFPKGQIDQNADWTWQEYRPGTSVGLSFSYKF